MNTEKQQGNNSIITGVIWKQILLFFFPILIGTFFQQLYNTVDAVIVGQFAGKEALSSVGGSSAQIISLMVGFFIGLSSGATVLLSQYFGAGKQKEMNQALHTAYAFSLVGGIVLGLIGIVSAPSLLRLMHTPQELMRDSILYMRVYFAGLVFVFIYNMGAAILRAIGDSKRPLYYLILCCMINIVLDLVLILGFHMGVLGAAVATLISQAVSAVFVTTALMYRTQEMKLQLKEIKIHKNMMTAILRIGLPTGIQAAMYSVSNIIVQAALNGFGVDTMAAWAAYAKIDSIFWMLNEAFGISVTTFVGQNYGAGKWDRVKKGTMQCLFMASVTAVVLSVLLITQGAFFFRIFTADAGVVEIGMRMMRLISPAYILFVFIEIFSGALRAQGYVFMPTLITMTGICFMRILWVTVIMKNGTLEELVFCYPITWLAGAIAMTAYYIYRQKKVKKYVV